MRSAECGVRNENATGIKTDLTPALSPEERENGPLSFGMGLPAAVRPWHDTPVKRSRPVGRALHDASAAGKRFRGPMRECSGEFPPRLEGAGAGAGMKLRAVTKKRSDYHCPPAAFALAVNQTEPKDIYDRRSNWIDCGDWVAGHRHRPRRLRRGRLQQAGHDAQPLQERLRAD